MKSGNLFAASLAYYICPLLTMAGAALVFKERFAKRQKFAIIFLAAGVVLPAVLERALPILALLIAASWSIYTLTRSYFNRPALHALFIETLLLAFALLVILPAVCETGVLWPAEADARLVGLFVLSGLVTTIPIMLLLEGMKIVPLRVVGILQYLAPTLTLAVSVFYSGATVTRGQLLSLALVWIGLALSFSAEISRFVTICARRSVALSRVLFRGRRGYVEEELLDVS
jgi:chloramphenicol-sensitive protein RarD